MRLLRSACFLPLLASMARGQAAVTIDHEAKHHLVFSNDWVHVFDVVVPAGDSTLYHVHANDYVYVTFGDVALKAQPMGSAQTDLVLSNGEVRFTAAPITHRVVNPSSHAFHNVTVEVLKPIGRPLSDTPVGEVVLENARVRATRIVLQPGQSTPQHEHRGPGLDIGVSAGTVSVTSANGDRRRLEYKPASYFWNSAPRVHTLTNAGARPVEIVEIEWK